MRCCIDGLPTETISRWRMINTCRATNLEASLVASRLGQVLRRQGQLDEAEQMHRRALAINEGLRKDDGVAASLVGLANVLSQKGQLGAAEECYRRALTINEKLGRKE